MTRAGGSRACALQLTRDSVSPDDAVRGPHVQFVQLSPAATLGELVGWVVDHRYLAGLPEGDDWVLRLRSRAGTRGARLTTRRAAAPRALFLEHPEHPLTGVGSVHLEWRPGAVDMED